MAGRRIDDHKFWAGSAEAGSVLPDGAHKLHMEKDDGHAGGLDTYEDTTEKIEATQGKSVSEIKKQPMKPGFRY